jgi:hypothetical protein
MRQIGGRRAGAGQSATQDGAEQSVHFGTISAMCNRNTTWRNNLSSNSIDAQGGSLVVPGG